MLFCFVLFCFEGLGELIELWEYLNKQIVWMEFFQVKRNVRHEETS